MHLERYVVNMPSLSTINLDINPLNAKLNPIFHLLAMFGAHPILHVSRIRVTEQEKCGQVILKPSKWCKLGSFF
jgi:hypothetical protein